MLPIGWKALSSFFLIILCALSPARAEPNTPVAPYNEIYQPGGVLRPAYQVFKTKSGTDPALPSRQMTGELMYGHPLGDKIQLLPIPLVLTREEIQNTVLHGSAIRGGTLAALFEDIIFEDGKKAIESGVLTSALIESIFRDMGLSLSYVKELWKGKDSSHIHFLYGPDLIRNPEGLWRALEDNLGNLGGLGDLGSIRQIYFQSLLRVPDEAVSSDLSLPSLIVSLFDELGISDQEWDSVAALLYTTPTQERIRSREFDLESNRVAAYLQSMKVRHFDISSSLSQFYDHVLERQPKLILNFVDPIHFKDKQWLYEECFKKRGIHLLNAPGTEVLTSKAWLPFVDRLTEVYFGIKPTIQTQPTRLLEKLELDPRTNEVVKLARGSQGHEVYIPSRLSAHELADRSIQLLEWDAYRRISGVPFLTVGQEHVQASIIQTPWADFQVDIRPILLALNPRSFRMYSMPWGRATPLHGSGLNNVSQGGLELVVLDPPDCQNLLSTDLTTASLHRKPTVRADLKVITR